MQVEPKRSDVRHGDRHVRHRYSPNSGGWRDHICTRKTIFCALSISVEFSFLDTKFSVEST